MSILSEPPDLVIGVDTHKLLHAAAAVGAVGQLLASTEVDANSGGYQALLEWARGLGPGRRLWAVEGTGSYGAGLTSHLAEAGEQVVEMDRPKRPARKAGAKSDQIDALRAAREVLSQEHPAAPRRRAEVEALRVIEVARRQAVSMAADCQRELQSTLVNAPALLRERLASLSTGRLVKLCAGLSSKPADSLQMRSTIIALKSTARRALAAEQEIKRLDRELAELVRKQHPELLAEFGVGPVVAARLGQAWSHPGRFRSEAAFARLNGSAPVEASSGQNQRHRLNRGGDRQLNSALHTVMLTRLAHDARTRAYVERRKAEGKSLREIQRCLKRYLSRHLFRVMESAAKNKCLALDKP